MRARALEPPTTSLAAARALLEHAMPIAVQSQPSGLDIVDVWVYLPTGGDRGAGWPSLEDDQAAILLILGAMAP